MASEHNLAVGFAMTAGAGLATGLGAALVFVPGFKNDIYLGISLSFAAGVMIFVSFIEIFVKSLDTFIAHFDRDIDFNTTTVEDYEPSSDAYHAAMGAFFGGIALTWLLDRLIHVLRQHYTDAENPTDDENNLKPNAQFQQNFNNVDNADLSGRSNSYTNIMAEVGKEILANPTPETDLENDTNKKNDPKDDPKSLIRMALITGVAVSLHNFPEGFATFIAAVEDPEVGASIAIAIGIHNIPEGICVAAPIYFATGNKWKAFMWGTLSGIAEPIAGGVGWIILSSRDTDLGDLTYAILFGMVAGMMVFISFSELIPTALMYDPTRKYFFGSLVAGFVVMAASLMLFVA